jgi:nitrous oxide reductase accessory protein NosL
MPIHSRTFLCAIAALLLIAGCANSATQTPPPDSSLSNAEQCPSDGAMLSAAESGYGRTLIKEISSLSFYPKGALQFDQS